MREHHPVIVRHSTLNETRIDKYTQRAIHGSTADCIESHGKSIRREFRGIRQSKHGFSNPQPLGSETLPPTVEEFAELFDWIRVHVTSRVDQLEPSTP
jgi:hypothetical protein